MAYEDRDVINNPSIYAEMVQKSGQSLSPCVEVTGHQNALLGSDDEEPRAALRDLEPSEIQHVPVYFVAEPSELGEDRRKGMPRLVCQESLDVLENDDWWPAVGNEPREVLKYVSRRVTFANRLSRDWNLLEEEKERLRGYPC